MLISGFLVAVSPAACFVHVGSRGPPSSYAAGQPRHRNVRDSSRRTAIRSHD